ncbi:hypothetical protein GCM10011518_18180 [Flavobacterium limi]|uniref:PKD domain-containing protein n=2 Tax=Flavobacterium limi TaxID=2045105 RepID=A0ABQ1U265_9FLAO|nr:hypothetical protein GCM10011518_18180 [Flavobacterium limi]
MFCTSFSFSQGEASTWYFGNNAGLKFHTDGSVTPLVDGQLNTIEGCATLSDSNGDLMFYTDGITVYNKKHQVMINGTGLKGHTSSSQSATIVQKPGSSNLFYIFTTTVNARIDGLEYSEIDINLDGGLGAVTANKNISIFTPVCEKLSVVKHANGIDYWIVTHGWKNNAFYAHLLSSSGINSTPVISNSGVVVDDSSMDNVMGYMKIAPNGKKLVACHQFLSLTQLFDFDTATGIVSNPIDINNGHQPYGAEFSPNSEVLYMALQIDRKVYQYDLKAPNIALSQNLIATTPYFLGALQLGPNNKIYIANYNTSSLGVINNPNTLGLSCDLQASLVDLGGKKSILGLPSFCQSYFNPSFTVKKVCLGAATEFKLNASQGITSASWDFGDGTASNTINPNHIYTATGTFNVSVTVTNANGSSTKTKVITIYQTPTAKAPQDILVCDDNNDGLHTFDLRSQDTVILNGQDPNLFIVNYFVNNVAITSPGTYINTVPYQKETITAEVSNKANGECKSSATFGIDVFDTPLPNLPTVIPNLMSCDNTSVGSDIDGKATFDLTQRAAAILNGQSALQFVISYYKDSALTIPIVMPSSYKNTIAAETIFVKVVNKDNPNCIGTTSFNLKVYAMPTIVNVVDLKQCDDDIDGISIFNLEEAINKITVNSATETISFHKTLPDAQNNVNVISNASAYTNQIVSVDKVYVRVANANGCYRIAQLNLIVSTTQIPSTYSKTFTQCDDEISGTNKDGISKFDFSTVTNEIKNIFPSGQLLDVTYYQNIIDALAEKNAIADISNHRNTASPNMQRIFIRVDSKLNNDCLGLGGYITLKVESVPIVKKIEKKHCDDNQDGLFAFDTLSLEEELLNGLVDVTVSYIDQNNNLLPSPLPNPFVTTSQVVKVVVTNKTPTACSFNSTITFVVDDLPQVFPVDPALTNVCDDEEDPVLQDGKYAFDTSSFESSLLGNQTGMIVNYYDSSSNRLSSPLPNPFVTGSQEITVEITNPKNLHCSARATLAFVVNPVPKIMLSGEELVCSNLPTFTKQIDAGLIDLNTLNDFNYQWSWNGNVIPGETNYSLTINKEGIFTVDVSNKRTHCIRTRTIKVFASDIASNVVAVVNESNNIAVSVSGTGDYVYALDDQNGYYQEENTFVNVPSGIHTVFIKDQNGCGTVMKEVAVFGIPKFFTPNQDSHNDYWNIEGVNAASNGNSVIQIFDRYGKLLKQIDPMSQGWDGTYLGVQMPADDYWYVVKLEDNRIFRGHFALKR